MFANRTLWIVQIVMGVYFIATGIVHFVVPEGLPAAMEWMYELSDGLHILAGTAEILGGLGLILPGLTKIQPQLTVFAAAGLVLVMVGAVIWHITSGEGAFALDIVLGAILAYIAYGRWKKEPLPGSFGAATA